MADRAQRILQALKKEEHVREEGGKLVFGPEAEVALFIQQPDEMMAIAKVASAAIEAGLLRVVSGKGEVYVFEADALAGFRIHAGEGGRKGDRSAGFNRE